jgi:hypothetical protein
MALDFVAARAVAQAKLLERALHDRSAWEIEVNGVRQLAVKVITPSQIVFFASFPPLCWVEPPEVAWLLCNGETLASRDISAPADGGCTIEWHLSLGESDLITT